MSQNNTPSADEVVQLWGDLYRDPEIDLKSRLQISKLLYNSISNKNDSRKNDICVNVVHISSISEDDP